MSHESAVEPARIVLGANVDCTDGAYGTLDGFIIDPLTRTVTHYIVRDQLDQTIDRLVPAGHGTAQSPKLLQLDCTINAVAEMPPYTESEFVTPGGSELAWTGVHYLPYVLPFTAPGPIGPYTVPIENLPPDTLALRRGQRIEATDGDVGELSSLVVDIRTGRIEHFVLERRDGFERTELTLPVSSVDHVLSDTVYLKLDRRAVDMLPRIPVRHPALAFAGFERVELVAIIFDSTEAASETLRFLQDVEASDAYALKIRQAAVLVRQDNGAVSTREMAQVGRARDRIAGGVIGGAVALAGAPIGVLLGALAGAVAGGVIGTRLQAGFSDAFLERLEDRLTPGRSALIMLLEHDWADDVPGSLRAIHEVIPHQQIIDTVVQDMLTARQ